jgi:MYXO-CTERM domain-containing protein
MALGVILGPRTSLADNPIIQTNYTADPAPMVHENKLYLFTTHDEDVTVNDFFTMNDWRVYSSTDVVNWTDHGSPLHYNDFSWAGGNAWAGQVIYRNSKFYFYVPVVRTNGSNAIGVAVSDNVIGPYEDALGRPLVTSDCGDIDPTVFIDDDGQAYLYWGNPNLCYVRLNEDMTSYPGSVTRVTMDTASFGTRSDSERPTSYEEGPWFYKRMGQYYLVYPGGPLPEHIAHSTSTGPTGPWTYRSVIMPAEGSSFTNHPGIVDYKGKSLFFYHNGALPGGGGYKRSVCVEEFTYGADGTIPRLRMTTAGASAVDVLNPFAQTEAETIAWETGIETERCSEGGMNVTSIDDGDSIKVESVEFGTGATSVDLRVAAEAAGGVIELRLDSTSGMVVGTCTVASTGGAEAWATQSCSVSGVTGKHDLFLRFTRGGFKFNWWKFSGPGDPGTGGMGGQGGAAGSGGQPVGGGGQGGVAGTSGSPPTGGALTTGGSGGATTTGGMSGAGGAASGTPASGAAGRSSSGGTSASGGGGQANTGRSSSDEGSCGCRVAGRGSKSGSLAALMLLGLLWRRSSRRRRKILS